MPGIYIEGADYTSARPLNQFGDAVVRGVAAEELTFGRVLAWENGKYRLAEPADGQCAGLCVNIAVPAGRPVEFIPVGNAESKDWTGATGDQMLTPGAVYFLQPGGKLGKMIPVNGYVIRVGWAASETVLSVTFDLKVR